MPTCVFRLCKNYGTKVKKDEGVTYHTFPSEEEERWHKWVNKVRAERSEFDWMPTKSSTLCSAHFEDQDKYTTPKGYVRLKKCAVPVILSYVVHRASMPSSLEDVVPRASTPTSFDDVNISDMDSIFDSPRKYTLKKLVRKLNCQKKVLQKKNKVLKNQNKRLHNKITSMKNIVKILKNNKYISEQQFSDLINVLDK